jgi:anti-anti-sigma factor
MTTPSSQKPLPPGLERLERPHRSAAVKPAVPPYTRQPAVVTLPGEIDLANASQVYGALIRALETGTGVVVADATETTFCDCAGVRTLARAHYQAAASGIDLRVASATSRKVRRILELSGAGQVLDTYPTLTAALNGPSRAPGTHSQAAGASASTPPCEPAAAADPDRGMT